MSWLSTIVLSFSADEFEDEKDESNHDCAALRSINAWLKRQGYDALADVDKGGTLGSNAVLFGGCYNYLDVEKLFAVVGRQKWKHPTDVQILFWDDNASKGSLVPLIFATSGRKTASSEKPGARARKRKTVRP